MTRTPIETLQQLRRQGVDDAARTLVARRAETEAARADVERAQTDVERERTERAAAGHAEVERAAQGEVQVADLQRLLGYEHASRRREQSLVERGQRARQTLEHAVVRDDRAEQDLTSARSESRAVDSVQERQQRQRERERELQAEEEAGETWQSSKR